MRISLTPDLRDRERKYYLNESQPHSRLERQRERITSMRVSLIPNLRDRGVLLQ